MLNRKRIVAVLPAYDTVIWPLMRTCGQSVLVCKPPLQPWRRYVCPLRTIRYASLCQRPVRFLWSCLCIGALKRSPFGKSSSTNTFSTVLSRRRRRNEPSCIRSLILSCSKTRTFRSCTRNFARKSALTSCWWKQRFSTKYRLVSSCSPVSSNVMENYEKS